VVGVILMAVGGVWIAQGSGTMRGSVMTGHSQYTVLGVVVVLVGVALLGWAWRVRGGKR
jgi:protein-S-isoprenylcysteine O-methyltransferase Ste14